MNGDRRRPHALAVVLIAAGALVTIGGLAFWAVSKAAADHALQAATGLRTLPVDTFTQYTQHPVALDYAGLWTGALAVILGAAVLMTGLIVAAQHRRPA